MKHVAKFLSMAYEKEGGHFTVLAFTTNFRVCFGNFGTLILRDDYDPRGAVQFLPSGSTLDEACKKCLEMREKYGELKNVPEGTQIVEEFLWEGFDSNYFDFEFVDGYLHRPSKARQDIGDNHGFVAIRNDEKVKS